MRLRVRPTPRMPKELIGKKCKTAGGDRLCFGYQLEQCKKAAAGARCEKGIHMSAEPGCDGDHALCDHS